MFEKRTVESVEHDSVEKAYLVQAQLCPKLAIRNLEIPQTRVFKVSAKGHLC